MLRWRIALLAAALSAAAALAGACGDDGTLPPSSADSGITTGAVGDGICPSDPPTNGDVCVLPEGTACAFSACSSSIAQCLGGLWVYGGNPAPQPVCPDPDPPAEGTACPPCWVASATCSYGSVDCTVADASANRTLATCPSGIWKLQYSPCGSAGADAGPPASADAGADVQGDSGLDAD